MPDIPDLSVAEPDAIVDGRRVYFVWHKPTITARPDPFAPITLEPPDAPTIPFGAMVEHRSRRTDRPCIAWIPWVDTGDPNLPRWTLLSLRPLSIAEPFCCTCCGGVGGIRDGRWWLGLGSG